MKNVDKPNYGNWIPGRMIMVFLIMFCIFCVLSVLINTSIIRGILIAVSVIFGALLVYMTYAYWLFGKNDGGLQKQLCNTLLDRLDWDGRGKALDIGTGSGRAAIYLAEKYPAAYCVGIDCWGNPWTYSRDICYRNARIEGVAERVSF